MSKNTDPPVDRFLKRLNISPNDLEDTFPNLYSNLNPILTALTELRTLRKELQEKEDEIHKLRSNTLTGKTMIPFVSEDKLVNWRTYFNLLQNEFNEREFKNSNWISVRIDFVQCFLSKGNEWLDKHDLKEFFAYTEDAILIKLKKYHEEGWLERNIPEKYHEAYRYRLNMNRINFQIVS